MPRDRSMTDEPHTLANKIKSKLPKSPWLRVPIGIAFVAGGLVGFLPILGFWMVPVGLIILSVDFPPARWAARKVIALISRATRSIRKSFRKLKRNS